MEHWDNAVLGARVAAHNMVCDEVDRWAHLLIPQFWSAQFGVNIKSVGVPSFGDEIVFTQGSVQAAPVRRRIRSSRPHRRRGHFQPRQVDRLLPRPDRAFGTVSTASARFRFSGEHARNAGRLPGAGRADRGPGRGVDGPRPQRTARRIPSAAAMSEELAMTPEEAFDAAMRYENRANPYPFFDELRKTPVVRVTNGIYAVTGYEELMALAHDPRVSSDLRKGRPPASRNRQIADESAVGMAPEIAGAYGQEPSFIAQDPPDHDRARRQCMRFFGPPDSPDLIPGQEPLCQQIVDELLDKATGKTRIDVVDEFAYPLPVNVICRDHGYTRRRRAPVSHLDRRHRFRHLRSRPRYPDRGGPGPSRQRRSRQRRAATSTSSGWSRRPRNPRRPG